MGFSNNWSLCIGDSVRKLSLIDQNSPLTGRFHSLSDCDVQRNVNYLHTLVNFLLSVRRKKPKITSSSTLFLINWLCAWKNSRVFLRYLETLSIKCVRFQEEEEKNELCTIMEIESVLISILAMEMWFFFCTRLLVYFWLEVIIIVEFSQYPLWLCWKKNAELSWIIIGWSLELFCNN